MTACRSSGVGVFLTTGAGTGAGAGAGVGEAGAAGAGVGDGADGCGFKKTTALMTNTADSRIARTILGLIISDCARIGNNAATCNLCHQCFRMKKHSRLPWGIKNWFDTENRIEPVLIKKPN
jgi:hypothetical protein